MPSFVPRVSVFFIVVAAACAQDAVTIRIDAGNKLGPYKPISGYFGYDEPNFTYAKNGSKLVGELGNLADKKGGDPVYIRTHFMLTTGEGTPGK